MCAFIQFLSALLTPVIGCITVYIAIQQHKLNKNKYKLDLFERRYSIYIAIKEFLSQMLPHPHYRPEVIRKYKISIQDHKFLFREDIHKLIKKIEAMLLQIDALNDQASKPEVELGSTQYQEIKNKIAPLEEELENISMRLSDYFEEYLKLDE